MHNVDTQGGAGTDDLDTINGGNAGDILILGSVNSARNIVLKDNTDNLRLNGSDFTLGTTRSRIMLQKTGSLWLELTRALN